MSDALPQRLGGILSVKTGQFMHCGREQLRQEGVVLRRNTPVPQ